jgi:hypothetical protein
MLERQVKQIYSPQKKKLNEDIAEVENEDDDNDS